MQRPLATDMQDDAIVGGSATWRDYVGLLRPEQWIKNVVVFAGPAAGLKLLSGPSLLEACIAFVAFCMMASATYALNDVLDREADASHPTKRFRPVARGVIGSARALTLAAFLSVGGALLAFLTLNVSTTIVLLLYFAVTLAYSLALKRRVILDVIILATGFVLRAWAGSLAVGVVTSEWLVACVFTLCLFMGFGKRRCEIAMIASRDQAGQHRPTLLRYTSALLDHLISVSAAVAVITFLLYTLDKSVQPVAFHKEHLFYTLPLVVYGVFRFAMLSDTGRFTGPTDIVLKDRAMLTTIGAWAMLALAIAYQTKWLGEGGIEAWIGSF